jgi:hypothetical protein
MANQSQKHGFVFENSVRSDVFNLSPDVNNTDIHDIPKHINHFNNNENCSIKTTGSNVIYCGDILRFYDYKFDEKNTIIVIKYKQTLTQKIVTSVYEIDYNKSCHKLLFGNLTRDILEKYVSGVKSIPTNVKGQEAKKIYNYLFEKKRMSKTYNHQIQINPKVSRTQSRVQCSISRFEKTLKKFITYKSRAHSPNILRDKQIVYMIESPKRSRKSKIPIS